MPKTKTNNKNIWRTSQPPLNEEIVIFVNHSQRSYHFIKWIGGDDWDIKLGHGTYVGPRNFEDGTQFSPEVKSKEFYWATKEDFAKRINHKGI